MSSRGGDSGRAPPAHLSTGCTECCGNVDYSTFANCGIFVSEDPCGVSREAIHSLLRRARRGSRTKQHRKVVRGGSQGPKRKVGRGCGRNRDRLGEFFLVRPAAAPAPGSTTIAAMPFPPSASAEHRSGRHRRRSGRSASAIYIYFGLIAVGSSGATAIVIALVSFAAIWLLVRLRGEEAPGAADRRRRS